jgi:1-acyl-sn-glycerol-3-phosphate acyltransferase
MTNAFVPFPIHWVTSDGNMRNPIMRFLLITLVGSIPKSKAIPDIETVSWIVDLIRNKRGVVGMYPEGQSSWTGTAYTAFLSSAKLLRLLRVPVVLAKTHGGYLTKPRWSHIRRAGKTEIEFSILFSPEQLHKMPLKEIDRQLNEALAYDDTAWSRAQNIRFKSARGAESLELVLYLCPRCGAMASLHSNGQVLECEKCGFAVEYRDNASFSLKSEGNVNSYLEPFDGAPFLDSIVIWSSLQEQFLQKKLETITQMRNPQPIFMDEKVILKKGKRIDAMKTSIQGKMELYWDRLEFKSENPSYIEPLRLPLEELDAEGVLKWNFFEFYQGMNVYRVVFDDPKASAKKYADALTMLRALRKNHLPGL